MSLTPDAPAPENPLGPPCIQVNAYDAGQDIADWRVGDILDVLEGISRGLPAASANELRRAARDFAPRLKRLRELLAPEPTPHQDDAKLLVLAKALCSGGHDAPAPRWEKLPPGSRTFWLDQARPVLDALNAVDTNQETNR